MGGCTNTSNSVKKRFGHEKTASPRFPQSNLATSPLLR